VVLSPLMPGGVCTGRPGGQLSRQHRVTVSRRLVRVRGAAD